MNLTPVERRIRQLDFQSKCPVALCVLTHLYGFSYADIAREVRRSPNMMTYYASGTTPVPPIVHTRLRNMITRARDHVKKAKFKNTMPDALCAAIIDFTDYVLLNYGKLHK